MKKQLVTFVVLLPLFLLLFSYKVVLGFVDLNTNQQETFDFLHGGEMGLEYTESEVSHLEDVRDIMTKTNVTFYGLLLILSLLYTAKRKRAWRLLHYGGRATVGFTSVLLLFAVISFTTLFRYFHELFFPQGNWQFSTESLLIQTFPLSFFIEISTNIFLLTLVLGIVFIVGGNYLKNVSQTNRE